MEKIDDMTTEERVLYWRMIMEEYEESGLQRIDYCKKNDISLSSFDYWKRRLKEIDQDGSCENQRLVEIKLQDIEQETDHNFQTTGFITEMLISCNGMYLHINTDTPMALIKQVVTELRYA